MPHRTTNTDTRLLTNLQQSTQLYTKSVKSTLSLSSTSTAALQAYASVLPPREAQVLNLVAAQMEEADDAARVFVDVVDKWVDGIADIIAAEEEVKRVARDRDILVTRLIKASKHSQKHTSADASASNNVNTSPSSSTAHSIHSLPTSPSSNSHSSNSNSNKKLNLARAELHYCEIELNNKEAILQKTREKAVVAGLKERCDALMRFASAIGEAGRLGVGAVDIWEREKKKANNMNRPENDDVDDDEHHYIDKNPIKKSLTNGVGSRFDTNANANINGISTCDNPSSELSASVSGMSNTSSIAPSQSASQIALVLAHPTPNSSGLLIDNPTHSRDNRNEDNDRDNDLSTSHNRGSTSRESDSSQVLSDRYGYKLDVPPAHAFGSGVEYNEADHDGNRDGHSYSYAYGNELGGFGSRGYPELRRRITEEDINFEQDVDVEGVGDGDVTPINKNKNNAILKSGRKGERVEEEEEVEDVDNTDDEMSDSPDDMRTSGDTEGGKKVKVIENKPFDRGRGGNRIAKGEMNSNVNANVNGRKAFSDVGVSPSSPIATHFGSFNMFRGRRGDTLPVRPEVGRERKRSFVGALAGLFHRDKDKDKDKDVESKGDWDEGVDGDGDGLVLPSSFVNMGGRRAGLLRRGDSEDGVGVVGRGKGKGGAWTTRTEVNLKSLSKDGGDSDDGHGGNLSRKRSRIGAGTYHPGDNGVAGGGVGGIRGGSMDVMSDTGVDYSGTRSGGKRRGMNGPAQTAVRKGNVNSNLNSNTRANTRRNSKTQAQTKKVESISEIRESEYEGERYGFDKWGVWGSRDDTRANVGASLQRGHEGGGGSGGAGKLKKNTQTQSQTGPRNAGASTKGAGLGIRGVSDEVGGKGEHSAELKIKGAAAAAASASGNQKQRQARSQTQAQAQGSVKDANTFSRSGSFRSNDSRGGGGGKRTLVSSSNLNSSILSYSPGQGNVSGSGASTPKARLNVSSTMSGGGAGGKRNSLPSSLSQSNSSLAQPARRSTVETFGGGADMSNTRPSLMSIVEGVADINHSANTNTTRRGSRLIEVHAPRPISDADLAAPLDVVLKKGRVEAGIEDHDEQEERGKNERRGRSETIVPVQPPPRVSSLQASANLKDGERVSNREHEHGHEPEHRQIRSPLQPLKSAMRTRSPSPATQVSMPTTSVVNPVNVQGQNSVPAAGQSNNDGNDVVNPDSAVDTDLDSEEFVDANSEVDDESDEAPPSPPHDKVISNSHLMPASTNTTVSPSGSATASTASPLGGSTSTTTRRKSVRMSLKPTFSPTPPAIDDRDSSDDGQGRTGSRGRYEPWGPASLTVPKSSSINLNSGSNPGADTSKGSGHQSHGSVRGDVWADSSEEDEEYSRARKLLWTAAKKMDKAGKPGKKDGR